MYKRITHFVERKVSEPHDTFRSNHLMTFQNITYVSFSVPNPRLTVLYFHGSGVTLHTCWKELSEFAKIVDSLSIQVIALEYPGYSDQDHRITDEHVFHQTYIQEMIPRLHKYLNWDWTRTILIGKCLGAYVAAHVATAYPQIQQLILMSSFFSIPDIIHDKFGYTSVIVPRIFCLPLSLLERLNRPIVFLHGCHDSLCNPTEMVRWAQLQNHVQVICVHENIHIQNIDELWPVLETIMNKQFKEKWIHIIRAT